MITGRCRYILQQMSNAVQYNTCSSWFCKAVCDIAAAASHTDAVLLATRHVTEITYHSGVAAAVVF